jgi:CRP-like cAMP-binding protein
MATRHPVVVTRGVPSVDAVSEKKRPKRSDKKLGLSPPSAAAEAVLKPAEVSASPGPVAPFDSRQFLTRLSTGRTTQEYRAAEVVFSQGDAADAVFYVQSGKVKLTVVSSNGKEAVVAILPETNFFGEGCLAGQPMRMATASTIEKSVVVRVTRQTMVALLHQEPEFAGRFLTHLLSRNVRMEADLVDHLFNSSEKRLARLLLLLANFGQESKPIPLIAKMSQETLAEMIGTTRSRVSFFMNRFRELGFVDYKGGEMHINRSLVSVVLHD